MPESERGNLSFDPPLTHGSPGFIRAWELFMDMNIQREVIFTYIGMGSIKALSFPTKEQAMMFRLRL